jgi:NADH-quinone oxidoreductase subunit L
MDFLQFDPQADFKLLLAVPLIPLVGYVVQVFFGRFLPRKGDWLVTAGMFVSMCITLLMAAKAISHGFSSDEPFFHLSKDAGMSFSWFYQTEKAVGDPLNMTAGLLYDGLGAAMLAVVGVVGFFVHLFSVGYMKGDKRYHLFFANISLFTVAMLGLVLSDNILFLFVFWEIMGLMSYLLIGHFAHDASQPYFHRWATWASKKAFLTTRVGDCCLLIGMVMFWQHFHTFEFTELWRLTNEEVARNGGDWPQWMTVAGLFIFGGTVGKSAQFPLHIWLPDAMAGPTPVSAMIHAATMVAAGVFLLGRTFPILSPDVLAVVTTTGAFTALFAATIGVTAFDLKAVLAWSTISQLGFMVAAIGTGGLGLVAGLFHMVTHAFFKSCLFLSAGSVILGCHHEQDMRKMGGLRKRMPLTFLAMGISSLAIAGIPMFSGFYSKDRIIQAVFMKTSLEFSGAQAFACFALPVAAMLTAFYMFRMMFMTFSGEYRGDIVEGHHSGGGHTDHDHHEIVHAEDGGIAHGHGGPIPKESPWPITVSLLCLASLGFLGGKFWLADLDIFAHHAPWFVRLVSPETLYPGVQLMNGYGERITAGMIEHAEHAAHTWAMIVSLFVAGLGILGAWWIYGPRLKERGRAAVKWSWTAFSLVLAIVYLVPAIGGLVAGSGGLITLVAWLATLAAMWFAVTRSGKWLQDFFSNAGQPSSEKIAAGFGELYHTVCNKYFIDEIVDATFIRLSLVTGKVLRWFDETIVDGLVLLVGRTNRGGGAVAAWIDLHIVDGAVNGVGALTQTFGFIARLFQTGRIQQYASFAVAGGLGVAAWMLLG